VTWQRNEPLGDAPLALLLFAKAPVHPPTSHASRAALASHFRFTVFGTAAFLVRLLRLDQKFRGVRKSLINIARFRRFDARPLVNDLSPGGFP
jgi:hypothetical protein